MVSFWQIVFGIMIAMEKFCNSNNTFIGHPMGLRKDMTVQSCTMFGLRNSFGITPFCENVLKRIFFLKFCNLSQQEENHFCNYYHFDKTSKRFFSFCSGWKKFQSLGTILTQENFDYMGWFLKQFWDQKWYRIERSYPSSGPWDVEWIYCLNYETFLWQS